MTAPRFVALGLVAALVTPSLLLAHHDWPADRTNPITLQGTVTAFSWANPHVTIAIEVQANGTVEAAVADRLSRLPRGHVRRAREVLWAIAEALAEERS